MVGTEVFLPAVPPPVASNHASDSELQRQIIAGRGLSGGGIRASDTTDSDAEPLYRLSIACAATTTPSVGHSNSAATATYLQGACAGSQVIAGVDLDLLTA
jgi:hypothetical protein